MYQTKVELACDLADAMLALDGWNVITITDEDGNESFDEQTQDRFNLYYGEIIARLEQVEVPFSDLDQ